MKSAAAFVGVHGTSEIGECCFTTTNFLIIC